MQESAVWSHGKFLNSTLILHCKKRPACNNVVENRPEQYFAAHIVPGCQLNIVPSIVQSEQYC